MNGCKEAINISNKQPWSSKMKEREKQKLLITQSLRSRWREKRWWRWGEVSGRASRGREFKKRGGGWEGWEGTDLSSSTLRPCLLGSHHRMDRHRQRTGRWMWEDAPRGKEGVRWRGGRKEGGRGQHRQKVVEDVEGVRGWGGGHTTQQQYDTTMTKTSIEHTN